MSKILAIYSTEEHIGKTMLGINLGVSLINEIHKTVVFVDFSAEEKGIPAWSALKFSASKALQTRDLSVEEIQRHLLRHSSQLSLLTVASDLVFQEVSTLAFVRSLFTILQELFDYIIVEVSPLLSQTTCEVIDLSDILLFMASSGDYECPVEIIGHPNFRLVLNQSGSRIKPLAARMHAHYYWLPDDALTVEAFWKNGTPFVIQFPHRPLSQMIGRLTRDIGEKQLGIALTGGAALGLSQLGILHVFQQHHIAIDMIIGTSFGALIGAAFAKGIELQRITRSLTDWALSSRPFAKAPFKFLRRLFLKGRRLQSLCDGFLHDIYFDDLQIPMNIVAIDIRSGVEVVFREGKVLDAVMFSMRIPGLFVPFKQTESYIVDGSVLYPIGVAPLKQLGAHLTIAIQVTPSPAQSQRYFSRSKKAKATQSQLILQENYSLVTATFDSLMERLTDNPRNLKETTPIQPDLLINPMIKDISWQDFHQIHKLIDYGIRAGEEAVAEIEKLKWGEYPSV